MASFFFNCSGKILGIFLGFTSCIAFWLCTCYILYFFFSAAFILYYFPFSPFFFFTWCTSWLLRYFFFFHCKRSSLAIIILSKVITCTRVRNNFLWQKMFSLMKLFFFSPLLSRWNSLIIFSIIHMSVEILIRFWMCELTSIDWDKISLKKMQHMNYELFYYKKKKSSKRLFSRI